LGESLANYGPIATAAGALVAAIAIAINGWRERRRKTLEACEKLVFDKDLRSFVSLVYTAVANGTYERDTAERRAGSDRDDTSTIINVVETVAMGVNLGMYDEEVARAYLTVYVKDLLAPYFLDPRSSRLASTAFLAIEVREMRKLFADFLPPRPPTAAEIARIRLPARSD